MSPAKTEETLHDYLRRHLERISEANARQLAEPKETDQTDVSQEARPVTADI